MAIAEGVDIPIWLNTACSPELPLREVVARAGGIGYNGLEVMAFLEEGGDRAGALDFAASHISAKRLTVDSANDILSMFSDAGMGLTLGVYHNMLTADMDQASANLDQLVSVINAAHLLGGRRNGVSVGTFAGMDATLDYDGNLEKFGAVFGPVLSYAAALGIDVSFENCQMEGWMATGQRDSLCNLAGTYQLRSMMVDAVGGAENLLWIPDPSHGLAQGDGVQGVLRALLMETPSRIRALHIKDTDNNNPEALHVRAMRGGFAPPASQRAHEWDVYGGRPTLIGFGGGGDMDWTEYLRGGATLLARGDGSYKPVIVENEDVWSKQTGNPAATWQANHAAHLNLAPLCYPLTDQGYQFNHTQRQVLQTPSVSEGMLLKTHASVVRAYAGK